jgi:hypothetical protein
MLLEKKTKTLGKLKYKTSPVGTGFPASIALVKEAQNSGSTPKTYSFEGCRLI